MSVICQCQTNREELVRVCRVTHFILASETLPNNNLNIKMHSENKPVLKQFCTSEPTVTVCKVVQLAGMTTGLVSLNCKNNVQITVSDSCFVGKQLYCINM